MSAASEQIELRDRIVEFRRVNRGEILANPKNPRRHPDVQRDALRNMLATVGIAGAALAYTSERAGGRLVYIDGHLRDEEIPANLPVLITDLDDSEADALLAGYDHLSAMAGQDDAALVALLQSLDASSLPATGYDDAAIRALVESVAAEERRANPREDAGPQIDRAQELQEKWQVKRGDLWAIGRHKLLCGDSTNAGDVARLMDGKRARIMFTDPPYNVDYEGKTADALKIANDAMSSQEFGEFLELVFLCADSVLEPGAVYYICHPDIFAYEFIGAVRRTGWTQARPAVVQWVKDSLVMGRGDYHSQSEPMLYGWKPGAAHHSVVDRTQSNVWNIPRPKASEQHPTMKPVELVSRALENSSSMNDIAYEPFAGSGTSLIAAEQTNRICYAMEICEKYVAVSLQRLADIGLTPRLA